MKIGDSARLSKFTHLTDENTAAQPETVQSAAGAQAKVKDALAKQGADIFDNVLAASHRADDFSQPAKKAEKQVQDAQDALKDAQNQGDGGFFRAVGGFFGDDGGTDATQAADQKSSSRATASQLGVAAASVSSIPTIGPTIAAALASVAATVNQIENITGHGKEEFISIEKPKRHVPPD